MRPTFINVLTGLLLGTALAGLLNVPGHVLARQESVPPVRAPIGAKPQREVVVRVAPSVERALAAERAQRAAARRPKPKPRFAPQPLAPTLVRATPAAPQASPAPPAAKPKRAAEPKPKPKPKPVPAPTPAPKVVAGTPQPPPAPPAPPPPPPTTEDEDEDEDDDGDPSADHWQAA
jgi:outer membrane biosynthesis protein TonB